MSVKTHYANAVMRAYEFYHRRDKLVYLYGCKGQPVTADLCRRMFEAYPEHYKKYSDREKLEIIQNSVGKIAFDCSGFVCACFNWLPQTYSSALYSQAKKEYPSYDKSRCGCMLYTTFNSTGRHIGLDVGSGLFAHMGNESTNDNIKKGIDSVRLEWFTSFPTYWEHYFEHSGVDYSGTSAEVIENEYR